MDILDVEVLQPKCRWTGGRDPNSNIVNVKLVVGRKVRISHKPIRGWGAPGNDDRSIVVKSRYHTTPQVKFSSDQWSQWLLVVRNSFMTVYLSLSAPCQFSR